MKVMSGILKDKLKTVALPPFFCVEWLSAFSPSNRKVQPAKFVKISRFMEKTR
jgi:hypothetical protein